MLDFARSLTLPSAILYAGWRATNRASPVRLRTRLGPWLELRPPHSGAGGNNDYGVAYEVFVHDLYEPLGRLEPSQVRLVVDIGTNVGFSVLYWLSRFPSCRAIAFEAHPGHAEQAARNFALNGVADRVELHAAGAGASEREAVIGDAGTSSVVGADGAGTRTRIVDLFAKLRGKRIDLLKMDIEGGEYEIMEDPRFEALDVGAIVMEWHARDGYGRDWTRARLEQLGFRVEDVFAETSHGMLWGLRH